MRLMIILALAFLAMPSLYAQNNFIAKVKDKTSREPIAGATASLPGTEIGNAADENGLVILHNVPQTKLLIRFSALGYIPTQDSFSASSALTDTLIIYMEADEMEEVHVSTTRSTRNIQDIPTRIEIIGGEEVEEKANMKPGDIRMLLSESTGIQMLQTSATTGNASIRIQGMDGRYTQILKDGFPLYAGFSSGLGLLQTPPLDLKQVEIVKGSSSTLYGGGAIAGLVNLISKTPAKERELRFLINTTSAGGLDLNGYFGQRFGKTGLTLYAARNSNSPYDPAGTGLTAIPEFERYTINPRLFFYLNDKIDVVLGFNASSENRTGGDMQYIKGHEDSVHAYFERNISQRISSQAEIKIRVKPKGLLSIKNSVDHFDRVIKTPGYTFDGTQLATFTEVNFSTEKSGSEFTFGANLFTDQFTENKTSSVTDRDYTQTTVGVFAQNTWDISKYFALESGLRGDYVLEYGAAILPRASLLYKASNKLSSRLTAGLGYKTPSVFSEESERIQYRNVAPVSPDSNKLEKSYGGNWDINYRTSLADNKITISINQLFFFTHLDNPLLLSSSAPGQFRFQNITGHIDAQGSETNIKIGLGHFKLFLGYTYTHTHIHTANSIQESTLTPAHHTNSVLMFEVEDKWKLGLEGYYYSSQKLSDGTTGRDYWLCGFMAERIWKRFSLFINFENFLDNRQSKFGSIYTGSITSPVFNDIYAPLDGFVINGVLKLNLSAK